MSVLLPFLNQKTDVCLYKRVFSVVLGKDLSCTSMSFFRTIAITKSNSEVLHHSPHAGVARWTSWFFLQPLLDFSTYSSAIPVTSPQRSSGGAAKWPIVSLPRTFMQNRDTRCRVGGAAKGTVSHEQKVWQVGKVHLLTSRPPCQPPFFSTNQLCSPFLLLFFVKASFTFIQAPRRSFSVTKVDCNLLVVTGNTYRVFRFEQFVQGDLFDCVFFYLDGGKLKLCYS